MMRFFSSASDMTCDPLNGTVLSSCEWTKSVGGAVDLSSFRCEVFAPATMIAACTSSGVPANINEALKAMSPPQE
eukprot:CAMPEP_0170625570 /NCGR_PEP_ID=MMETSP0224-20130122/30830_1 /TAXON_ID=285029 /ORGANISM="Togula jolla, Strain CCCM 725" /LENGTH=74 /DNA_ID=CAMNT_0010952155 /DNA_START=47 /DNA_END=271 /DNA_ORIENTATION=+